MRLEQLRNQLQYEIQASPKKAAALGIALLVGCYFWIPMVWNLLPDRDEPAPQAAADIELLAAAPAVVAPQTAPMTQPAADWQALDKEISRSSRLPALAPSWQEDSPFVGRAPEPEAEPLAEEMAAAPGPMRPEELGLSLSGTVVGIQRRMAVISGNVYDEGEDVHVADGITFRLARVFPDKVVLSRDGELFELGLPLVTGDVQVHLNPRQ